MSDENFDFHFIALGGVGQSALAKILLRMGYRVSGSDIEYSKYVHLVEDLGAKVYIGHSKDNIKGAPKVVVSSAIKEDNPELIEARARGLDIIHRSDCLKYISELFPCFIGCSGTHGKTTTSGLLSFVLENLEQKPSYAIGGIIPKLNINAQGDKSSKYFVAELDESDGTIAKYSPDILIINNLEADHLDYYKNGLEDILKTFKKTVGNMPPEGVLFLNGDCEGIQAFRKIIDFKNIITYGIEKDARYTAKNIVFEGLGSCFDVFRDGIFLTKIKLIIPGLHNVYNALAIASVLDYLGFSDFSRYFEEFSGMGRRFQIVSGKRAKAKDITIIDDYAHHPNEIKSTLRAIKDVKKTKKVIFQPHRYTRLKGLWEEFLDSFSDIDELFVVDVFNAGDKFDPVFNSKNFSEAIAKKGVNVRYIEGKIKEAADKIAPFIKNGDIVLTLGAGDITEIGGYIDEAL